MIDEKPTDKLVAKCSEMFWDYLQRSPGYTDRRNTGAGSKTKLGLAAVILRLVREQQEKGGHPCPTCGAANDIVNQCGCDPNNMPTRPKYGAA